MAFFRLLLVIALGYGASKFCYRQTEGFALTKIHSELSFDPQWEVENPPLPDVFDQPFTYLAAGGQAYAFVSEDGQYVLKFFKHHLRRLPLWFKVLPLWGKLAEKREIQKQKRARKLFRDFNSYKIAIEQLPEETGVCYVHLNKGSALDRSARIVDKLGIEHRVSLDKVEFVLQKRADLALEHLDKLVLENRLDEAKSRIDSLFSLIRMRCNLGVYDEDPRIHRNVGFIDGKAILIDVGRLKFDPRREDPRIQNNDLIKIMRPLQKHFAESCPTLCTYVEEKLDA